MKNIHTLKNIYITSDEEIKEGDWVYYENGDLKGIHKVINGQRPKTMYLKKIILTTDQDLIKDGVQKIDDKFLEWFVKNPICDEIEIEKRKLLQGTTFYKIIIPKEEPKQETLEEAAENYVGYTVGFYKTEELQGINDFLAGAKWQQERSYSEEDVLMLLRKRDKHNMNHLPIGKWLNPKDWFEKFKKK